MRPVGPPAPNVGSFGSAEVNLQNPVYRAQTAVDVGENPFEYLQKILGTASAVTSAVLDNETAKIKGELSMIRMEEEKEREARQEERYKKAEAREAQVEEERALRQEANRWGTENNQKIGVLEAAGDLEGINQLQKSLVDSQPDIDKSQNIFLKQEFSTVLGRVNSTKRVVENQIDSDNTKAEGAAAWEAQQRTEQVVAGVGATLKSDPEFSEGIIKEN
jgi:hypothetical protein